MSEESINCRVRIWGHYHNKPFVYTDPPDHGSQYYHHDEDGNLDPSTWWWEGGDRSCDCARSDFANVDLDCGHDIYIDFIQPLQPGLTTLCLMESILGVINTYLYGDPEKCEMSDHITLAYEAQK